MQARADSDWVQSLAFLHHRGFSETMRMHRLVLDVAAATVAPFADVERRLAAQGIVLTNLADEQRRIGDACWMLLCDLHNDARDGWPNPDPDPGPPQLATIEEVRRLHHPGDRDWPIPCFLAVRDGEYVGFAGSPGTAVRPAFRGQGIATALKVRVVVAARQRGVTTLRSSSGNPAMLKVNEHWDTGGPPPRCGWSDPGCQAKPTDPGTVGGRSWMHRLPPSLGSRPTTQDLHVTGRPAGRPELLLAIP